MWAAGVLASISSITYPAISAFVSMHSDADKQGVVQGMVTGMRGLCNGLGPAMFGVIFYLFHVDLNENVASSNTYLNSANRVKMIPHPGGGVSTANLTSSGPLFDSMQPVSQVQFIIYLFRYTNLEEI